MLLKIDIHLVSACLLSSIVLAQKDNNQTYVIYYNFSSILDVWLKLESK